MKFTFVLHPLFIIFSALLIYLGYFILLISYIIAVLLHEFAHSYIAEKLGYKLNKITLMPHGASLSGNSDFYSTKDEIMVAIAGPLFNLILMVVCIAIWWVFPVSYFYTEAFVYANLAIAVINFLPVFPLDGGRVALALLNKRYNKQESAKKIRLLGIVLSSILLFFFVLSTFFIPNFTLLIFGSFLFLTAILEDNKNRYVNLAFLLDKSSRVLKGLKIINIAVSKELPLYKLLSIIKPDALTTFIVVDKDMKKLAQFNEKELQQYIKLYPASTKLDVIFSY